MPREISEEANNLMEIRQETLTRQFQMGLRNMKKNIQRDREALSKVVQEMKKKMQGEDDQN